MPQKIGEGSQIINFNFVSEFVAENLDKILYSTFAPGVLKFTYIDPPLAGEIEITEFSGLIRPRNKDFLVKVDTMSSLKLTAKGTFSPYCFLVARMDWLTPSIGYDYDSATYGASGVGISGYSGYFSDPSIYCTFTPNYNSVKSLNHGLTAGDIIRFDSTISGITANLDYYVISILNVDNFTISTAPSGALFGITGTVSVVNTYRKMNSHIVRFDLISSTEFDPDYDIILAQLLYTGATLTSISTAAQTQCYLTDYCINYDVVQRSGYSGVSGFSYYDGVGRSAARTLIGTNPDYIGAQSGTHWHVGNASGNIPRSNSTMNVNLNAQYLKGITASNSANSIGLKNDILSRNTVAARLFLNGFEYAIGKSGITSYTGFSGYTGISGWGGVSGYSAYSGYIPINNSVLQTNLNVEYLGGYKVADFTPIGHTHNLDEINDGTTYARVIKVDTDGLITSDGIYDGALEYRHQSTVTPFRYDSTTKSKIFALAGEIGLGGSTTVTFRKTFSVAPRVFILNNEAGDWKVVDESTITTTGFIVHHHENTTSSVGNLVADATAFSTHWLAVGELL